MANATLSINQLLGSGAVAKGKKIAAFNVGDALLGAGKNAADFQALLASFGKLQSSTGSVGKILEASTIEATTGAKKGTGILAEGPISLTPEFLAALKSLTPEQLETLKLNAASDVSEIGDATLGILDSLSTIGFDNGEVPEFFTVVDDPKLAEALANLAAQVKMLQIATAKPDALEGSVQTVAFVVQKPQQSTLAEDVSNLTTVDLTDFEAAFAQLQGKPIETITVTNTEGDSFDLLKKLAFADLAPFLTQPRVVRVDNRTVMKVAQGPSFLNDEGTDATAMTLLAGLVPALPKAADITPTNPKQVATPVATTGNSSVMAALLAQSNGNIPSPHPATAAFKTALDKAAAVETSDSADQLAASQATATGTATAAATTTQTQAVQTGTPLLVTVTPNNAATRGFTHVAKGLDNGLSDIKDFDLSTMFDDALKIHADQTLPANSSTSLISARSAGAAHPSTHLVSIALQRAASEMPAGTLGERQFTIQLDPPNMGRLKITLDFIENGKVKAKMLAERPETVSMLQKDAALLERALQGSGFDASGPDSLSFDLADSGDFSQGFGGGNGGHEGKGNSQNDDGTDFANIENTMAIFVDPETGLTHVNVMV